MKTTIFSLEETIGSLREEIKGHELYEESKQLQQQQLRLQQQQHQKEVELKQHQLLLQQKQQQQQYQQQKQQQQPIQRVNNPSISPSPFIPTNSGSKSGYTPQTSTKALAGNTPFNNNTSGTFKNHFSLIQIS